MRTYLIGDADRCARAQHLAVVRPEGSTFGITESNKWNASTKLRPGSQEVPD